MDKAVFRGLFHSRYPLRQYVRSLGWNRVIVTGQ